MCERVCALTIPLLWVELVPGTVGSFLCGREESCDEPDDRPLAVREAPAEEEEAP